MSSLLPHSLRSRLLLAVSLLAVAAFLGAGASAASAAVCSFNVDPSCFEGGDGNLAVDHGGSDWATPAPNLVQKTDDDTLVSQFGTGSKEQDPGNWDLVTGTAPSKADILHAAFANEVVNGDLFFYGAFQRLDGSGNANVSFELNKVQGLQSNGNDPVPVRSEGDLLITFDGNNANGVRVGMCIWHGDSKGESSSAAGSSDFGWYTLPGFGTGQKLKGSGNCTTLTTVKNPTAIGAMNNGSAVNHIGANKILSSFDDPIADNRFGEMSVDVSAALKDAGIVSPCLSFGSVWMHSRSSDAPLSSMQDYVGPSNIHAATPCSIDIEKSVAVQKPGAPVPGAGDYADADSADSAVVADTGDTLHYLVTVTNPGANAITLENNQPVDGRCNLTLDSQVDSNGNADATPALLDPGDVWTYSCTHVLGDFATDGNLYTNVASVVGHQGNVAGCGAADPLPCVHDSDPANVQRAGRVEIEKVNDGGAAGDQFSFGTSSDLSGSDFSIAGGQTQVFDHVVPNSGAGSVPGTYTVSEKNLAAGYRLSGLTCTDSDANGTASTADASSATATINVESGETVHCTFTNRFTAPGIAIDKTGPASATAGDLLPYTLTVTNPGQEPLAASTVIVTDPQCTTLPALQAKNTGAGPDSTPDSLDPGDSWVYTCSGQTQKGQTSFVNQACAQGTDTFGRQVNACDSVTTTLAQQVVLGTRSEPGTAHLAGLSGCVSRKFYASVKGKSISKVVFSIDGRKRATLQKPDRKGRYKLLVNPRKFKPGSHLLLARSTFVADSQTKPKTLRLRFSRCVRHVAPAFTG